MNPHREKCSGCSARDELLAVAAAELDETTRMLRDAHGREAVQIATIKRAAAAMEQAGARERPISLAAVSGVRPWLGGVALGFAFALSLVGVALTITRWL